MWAGPGPWPRGGGWLCPSSLSANHTSFPSSGSATGGHWSSLRTILSHCPPGELPECLRVVSHKLLSNSVALPQWLVELFQVSPWHWGAWHWGSHGTGVTWPWGHMALGGVALGVTWHWGAWHWGSHGTGGRGTGGHMALGSHGTGGHMALGGVALGGVALGSHGTGVTWHWGITCDTPLPPQATDAVALLKVLLSFDLLQLATEVALHSMDQSRHSVSAPLLQGSGDSAFTSFPPPSPLLAGRSVPHELPQALPATVLSGAPSASPAVVVSPGLAGGAHTHARYESVPVSALTFGVSSGHRTMTNCSSSTRGHFFDHAPTET